MDKAIFLDRDGVINYDQGFVNKIEDFIFIPKVFESLKRFQKEDYKLFIITNQSGIGKGFYTLEQYQDVNNYMLSAFKRKDITIEKVYFCLHHPDSNCDCRKPKTKFIKQATKDFNLDISQSWVIGDKLSDIKMGKRVECNTALINSRYVKDLKWIKKFKDLSEVCEYILRI